MPTVSQGSLPDMTEEVLGNFSAILESMDFAQELELLGIRKLHFRQRKRAIRELRAMGIGLWRLGLKRSFPSDGEFLFERFMRNPDCCQKQWHILPYLLPNIFKFTIDRTVRK